MLVALAGCSSDSIYGNYFKLVRQTIKSGFSDGAITKAQAAAIPYASLGYRYDGSTERLLVLATTNATSQIWTSANHVVLAMDNGRVVRSVGLAHNIAARTGKDLRPIAQAIKASITSQQTWDLPDSGLYSLAVRCRAQSIGPQTIKVLETAIATIRVDEQCIVEEPHWSFTDTYWLDAENGFVWRTRQHIGPHGDVLDIEIFRPPG